MKVAVVGSGVAGLGAAYVLEREHEVHLFERDARAGGHAHTVDRDGLALDTGFLVHNGRNYPLLSRLFGELGIATHESDMSFSVSCRACGLEYAGRSPFARPRNAVSPSFLGLLAEIGRWLRTAPRSLDADADEVPLAEWLDRRRYSQGFREHFLVPLTSALWSAAPERALDLPAGAAIRFFANHGMLGFGRFGWRTVTGGSRSYVEAIGRRLGERLHLGRGVHSLRRLDEGAEIRLDDGTPLRFDHVVVATHADDALRLLERPTVAERRVLGAFPFTRNEVVLHTDASFLPHARRARSSWNYRIGDGGRAAVTYHLNRLQGLDAGHDYLVTLNEDVADAHVLGRWTYSHPLFTVESLRAQRELPALADERVSFAGAWSGNGFHEDGLASGVAAAGRLGVVW